MQLRTTLLSLLLAAAATLCSGAPATPAAAAPSPAGGTRPLNLEIGGEWVGNGVSFSAYRRGQSPNGAGPTEAQVLEDLRLVSKHWGLLRTYELTPANEAALRLARQHKIPVRFLLGVWINPEKTPEDRARNEAQVAAGIKAARDYPELVAGLLVGNETQVEWTGHLVAPEVLLRCIRETRAGTTVPVSVADDYNFWNKPAAAAIAAEIDFITLHMYALWNGRGLEEAMDWTAGIYKDIQSRHPGKMIVIGETGWATSHDPAKNAPGQEAALMKAPTDEASQLVYLRQHYAWVARHRVPTVLFEAFDEEWKGSGSGRNPLEAEKHWGVFDENRQPKSSFRTLLHDVPFATRRL
jgi:exo-beta-1,3-glucanase (GH17 family)